MKEYQSKIQKLEDRIFQLEAEASKEFSCITVNPNILQTYENNNNNFSIKSNNSVPIPHPPQPILNRFRADSQTSTSSFNNQHFIKSHETTNSASYNSETNLISKQDKNGIFPEPWFLEFDNIKAENNRLKERNEDLEEKCCELRNHLYRENQKELKTLIQQSDFQPFHNFSFKA